MTFDNQGLIGCLIRITRRRVRRLPACSAIWVDLTYADEFAILRTVGGSTDDVDLLAVATEVGAAPKAPRGHDLLDKRLADGSSLT